ncbi:MAG: hypothetical protein AB1521_14330 [Bacteroidota bacterium]
MKKTILFWVLAFIITIASAVYQRVTGPTYPLSGSIHFEGQNIKYKLERSHSTSSDYEIRIETGDELIRGTLYWKKLEDHQYEKIEMSGGKILRAKLPAQKRLEKLQYYIKLMKENASAGIPPDGVVTIRFKDDVPMTVLIPHIIAMFLAMFFSTRTGLEFFNNKPKLDKLALWTIIVLFIGGFPLGFAMNGIAFGEMWGGWPFGSDVTDNKTQVAFIGWLIAFFMIKKNKNGKIFALLAALLVLVVYLIPHSL